MTTPPGRPHASTSEQVRIRIGAGSVRGLRVDGAVSYRGIPYAADPVGPLRFAPPNPVQGLGGRDLDGSAPSPAVPQPPSRMEALMGRPNGPTAEAGSLTLNIWAPLSASPDAPRPVLFWLHGGALVSGSAGWGWYDGARLAAEQDLVVVTASYRLGALGYLDVSALEPGAPGGNRGFLDQATALEWVAANIAAFGGDATAITVGGQSSGAESAALLAGSSRTRHVVRRLLLQSGGSHGWVQTSEQSAALTDEFLEVLSPRTGGIRPTLAQLRDLPVDDLLDAQVELLARRAARGDANPPFGVVDDETVPIGGTRTFLADRYDLDLLTGWTRDELQGMGRLNPAADAMSEDAARELLGHQYGDQAAALLAHYRTQRPSAKVCDLVSAINGDAVMMAPLLDLAQERAACDAPTYVYRFDWSATPYGACHCIDLPFTFGTFASWSDAAMLGDADLAEMESVSASLRAAIGSFVRTGRPTGPDAPRWAPWSDGAAVATFAGPHLEVETGLGLAERDQLRAPGRGRRVRSRTRRR